MIKHTKWVTLIGVNLWVRLWLIAYDQMRHTNVGPPICIIPPRSLITQEIKHQKNVCFFHVYLLNQMTVSEFLFERNPFDILWCRKHIGSSLARCKVWNTYQLVEVLGENIWSNNIIYWPNIQKKTQLGIDESYLSILLK